MRVRLANIDDLEKINKIYIKIVEKMHMDGINLWNKYYPFETFEQTIKDKNFYVVEEEKTIVSAFGLTDTIDGCEDFDWKDKNANCKYLRTLGVNVEYTRKGIGKKTIEYATKIAKDNDVKFLRLLVAEFNTPAISLYKKMNFGKVPGFTMEGPKDNRFVEIGFEMEI